MSDIYAEFGVNNAVISSDNIEEHEQAMLAKPIEVRDGDDRIEAVESDESTVDETEGEAQEVELSESDESDESGETEGEAAPFQPVGEPSEELVQSSERIAEHEGAFTDMVDTAIERGLSAESVARIQQEYAEDGLTEKSYQELAAAGYSKNFVDSYLRGQEALVEQYVAGVIAFAGGQQNFDALYTHLQTNSPDSAEALVAAMENRDLKTVKAIINLAAGSRSKTFGKPAARSVTKRGIPAAAVAVKTEGFSSSAQMIKAMSDPRYATDAEYRRSVEQKVAASSF
ncbi:head assembly [Dickeya phage Ninurta]|uniref:Capsid assembly protein n=1 Tax=Dickeya phage Ninurta TaxID=2163631 RepID=A0A2S1GTD7_9CAUD|nr:head assembly [Dickeya phage Ninurta]AWD92651.1 capsid assembly protein [Dickeya phage Ninurta]